MPLDMTPAAMDNARRHDFDGLVCLGWAGTYNVMVAVQGGTIVSVPLSEVTGRKKRVNLDHDWIQSARRLGSCLGVTDDQLLQLMDSR